MHRVSTPSAAKYHELDVWAWSCCRRPDWYCARHAERARRTRSAWTPNPRNAVEDGSKQHGGRFGRPLAAPPTSIRALIGRATRPRMRRMSKIRQRRRGRNDAETPRPPCCGRRPLTQVAVSAATATQACSDARAEATALALFPKLPARTALPKLRVQALDQTWVNIVVDLAIGASVCQQRMWQLCQRVTLLTRCRMGRKEVLGGNFREVSFNITKHLRALRTSRRTRGCSACSE